MSRGEKLSVIIGFAALVVALLAYLAPFGPIGPSPFSLQSTEPILASPESAAESPTQTGPMPIVKEATERNQQPTLSPIPPTPEAPIDTATQDQLLALLSIQSETRIGTGRGSTIFRPDRSSSLVVIPDYPLKQDYTSDDLGHLYTAGGPIDIPSDINFGDYLAIDWGKWENYLGVFDFTIRADTM